MLIAFRNMRKRLLEELRLALLRYPEDHPTVQKTIDEIKELDKKIEAANKYLKERFGWKKSK